MPEFVLYARRDGTVATQIRIITDSATDAVLTVEELEPGEGGPPA